MAKRAPHHNRTAVTVWALARHQGPVADHLGIYTDASQGRQEAERLIKRIVGMAPQARLRLAWERFDGVWSLHYGRDAHDFRFRLEPWPLDGEA